MADPTPPDRSLPKSQRLRGKRNIARLYQQGGASGEFSFTVYPFRIVFLPVAPVSPPDAPAWPQVLFAVPKRRFRKASDRNLIRRRVREAYRLHKELLRDVVPPATASTLLIAFTYIGNQIFSFSFIEKKLTLGLRRLAETIRRSPDVTPP